MKEQTLIYKCENCGKQLSKTVANGKEVKNEKFLPHIWIESGCGQSKINIVVLINGFHYTSRKIANTKSDLHFCIGKCLGEWIEKLTMQEIANNDS